MKPYIDEALKEVKAGNVAPWNVDDLRAELHAHQNITDNALKHLDN